MVLRPTLLILLIFSTNGSEGHIKGDLGQVIERSHHVKCFTVIENMFFVNLFVTFSGMAFPCVWADQAGPWIGSNERTSSDHWFKVSS